MKTFLRLSLFALVSLGVALIVVGNITDVYAQSTLEIGGKTGINETYQADAWVEATFVVKDGGNPVATNLIIIGSQGLTGYPTSVSTELPHGSIRIRAKITKDVYNLPRNDAGYHEVSITAKWVEKDKEASQVFLVRPAGPAPITIVVEGPVVDPSDPESSLAVGDTFKQTISIENNDSDDRPTLPLSAWQMDVVFNPLVLELVDVTEGDFLKEDEDDTFFFPTIDDTPEGRINSYRINEKGRINVSQVRVGGKGISLKAKKRGTLLTIKFKVLAFSEEVLGIHNVRLQSDIDTDTPPDGIPDRISYAIKVLDVFVATSDTLRSYKKEDVNQDEMINIQDLVLVAASIGTHNPRADVNNDGFVNVLDIITIYNSPLWDTSYQATTIKSRTQGQNDPPPIAPSAKGNVDAVTIQEWIDLVQVEDNGSIIFDRGIANLEALLNSKAPTKTRLLMNYPNPFNPETWIPYQLAESTNVTVTIHSMNGTLIRTLDLGHQSAGLYQSKSRAAYWDGRNEFGEQAASGVYFYTLTTGKFSATRKMLILK